MSYLKWNEQTITDFSEANLNTLYAQGYVFGRVKKGYLSETRSLRINLSNFELTSENRRVLRKTDQVTLTKATLPLPDYHWSIGKLAKDFYDTKFGNKTFSANKVKELLTDPAQSNFNIVFVYTTLPTAPLGYAIAFETSELLHYSYPFYRLDVDLPNLGLGMMLKAIEYARESGKKYVYLGSYQRPTDIYKLQFTGLEWWNKHEWSTDLERLKHELAS